MQQLAEQSWQTSALLAVVGFVAIYWIVPSFLKGPLAPLASAMRPLAWLLLVVLGFTAVLAFLRGETRRSPHSSEPWSSWPLFGRDGPIAGEDPQQARTGRSQPSDRVEPIWTAHRSPQESNAKTAEQKPTSWSYAVLRRMEWKRLEYLAADYYRVLGFRAETLRCGADGGIDIKLYRGDTHQPVSIVQCKAWTRRPVGVKPVRELLGVMTQQRVATDVFVTTSAYTSDAIEFARGNKIALVDGIQFLDKLQALPEESRAELLRVATEGDWTTPSCPSCGTKMIMRQGGTKPFWGCASFPRCRHKFQMQQQ